MKIAIIGYGKMGKTIERLAIAAGHEIVLKIGVNNLDDFNQENLQKAAVAIEFSHPDHAFQNIKHCLEWGIPVVSGTTAWLDKLPLAKTICEQHQGAFLYASNFSIGVNIFFAINQYLAKLMNPQTQYDVQMEEIHHTQKLDAPSGTGITLAEALIQEIARKTHWKNEKTEQSQELAIISKRIDNVPGTHAVSYQSNEDSIEIIHTAHSREGFAKGAILAAAWLIGKQGYFEMKDVLGMGD